MPGVIIAVFRLKLGLLGLVTLRFGMVSFTEWVHSLILVNIFSDKSDKVG